MEPIDAQLIVLSKMKMKGVAQWDAEFYCGCSACRFLSSSYFFSFSVIEFRPRITSPVIVVGGTRLSRVFPEFIPSAIYARRNAYEFYCACHFHSRDRNSDHHFVVCRRPAHDDARKYAHGCKMPHRAGRHPCCDFNVRWAANARRTSSEPGASRKVSRHNKPFSAGFSDSGLPPGSNKKGR